MAEYIKRQINNLRKALDNNKQIYRTNVDYIYNKCTSMVHPLHNNRCKYCDKDLDIITENHKRMLLIFDKKIDELRNILNNSKVNYGKLSIT